jgi:hypothetical protein
MKLDSLSTPEGERRILIYSAAWAKQQEKDNYQTTENGNGTQRKPTESRPRNPEPWSPPENPFPTKITAQNSVSKLQNIRSRSHMLQGESVRMKFCGSQKDKLYLSSFLARQADILRLTVSLIEAAAGTPLDS